MNEDEYYDFLDWLDDRSTEAFSKATNRDDYDSDTRQRWMGAMWAFDLAVDYLDGNRE